MIARDGVNKSLWQNVEPYSPQVRALKNRYDVVIAGGGITGISTGLLLQKAGKKCIILEAHSLGFGTTSGTTAHLNALLDTPYSKIKKNFDLETAVLVRQAAEDAIDLIRSNILDYGIACDFENTSAYLFARDAEQEQELKEIYKVNREVNLACEMTDHLPLPMPFVSAMKTENQAKFHPVKYIHGLASEFEKAGGTILFRTRVLSSEQTANGDVVVTTDGTSLRCNDLVYATHIPPGVNLLHLRCIPWRSYAIAFQLKDATYPEELFYDMYEPYHYYRTQQIGEELYFIIGGEDHKTAQESNAQNNFIQLQSHARSYFNITHVKCQWSSQYYEATDGLPYIGNLPGNGEHVYVATGFGGNGMIYSNVAAKVISTSILKGSNSNENIFHPGRLKPIAGFKEFIGHNTEVAKQFIKKMVPLEKLIQVAELAPGEGRVIDYEGSNIALSKDIEGVVRAVSPVCTHLKCQVNWNNTEQSWDCPCHGARYSPDGKIMTGPATQNLESIELTTLAEVDKAD